MPSKRSRSREREKKRRMRSKKSFVKWKADFVAEREAERKDDSDLNTEEIESPEKERKMEEREDIDYWETKYENEKAKKKVESCNRVLELDKERKRKEREEIKKDADWWKDKCYLEKERKREERDELKKDVEKWKDACDADNERKREEKSHQSETETEYQRISKKHKTRKIRIQRSGKEKLQQNLKSKKGMRLIREEGRLIEYSDRHEQNVSETVDWKKFMQKSKRHEDMVNIKKPDLIERLNEESRLKKENLRKIAEERKKREKEQEENRQRRIEEEGGEWVFNPEYSEFFWEGDRDPIDDDPPFIELSEQDELNIKLQEEARFEAMMEEKKAEVREKRRQKIEELKAAMNNPIEPFPEGELCEYEKLRISNIQEREKAMAESGLFDDLNDYKSKVGLR